MDRLAISRRTRPSDVIFPDEDRRLLDRAAAIGENDIGLKEMVQREGLDLATAWLYQRVLKVPANADFLHLAKTTSSLQQPPPDLVGIIPGAFYREHRHTGADGSRVLAIARELGCQAEVIPIASFGRREENIQVILDWLHARRGRRCILISLSKGGADLQHAFALPASGEAFADVEAWISLSGVLQGTPLVPWLQRRPLRWWAVCAWLWWHGHTREALEELHHVQQPMSPPLPTHLRIIHVCGFPLRRHLVHRWAPRAYERLATLGPNDGGGILLEDVFQWPGIVCPIWGADHYLTPVWDALPLLRGIVTAATSAPPHAIRSANPPRNPPATRSMA